MVDRVKFSPDGLFVSVPSKSVNSTNILDFVFHPNQQSYPVILEGQAVFTTGGRQTFTIPNSTGLLPYILLKSSDNRIANPSTYYARARKPYSSFEVVNNQNVARTVHYTVFM